MATIQSTIIDGKRVKLGSKAHSELTNSPTYTDASGRTRKTATTDIIKPLGSPGTIPPAPGAANPPATTPQTSVDPNLLATSANQEAQSLYEQTKDRDVDIRDSSKIINELAVSLAEDSGAPPAPPSLASMFAEQRQQLGIEPLETDLANIDSEMERINTEALVDSDRTGEAPVGQRVIDRQRGKISREAQRELAFLNIERSAVARQLDNKLSALQMTMQFTQQDFANASQKYEADFSRNMQLIDLFTGLQDREDTAQDRLAKSAAANLQTVWNSLNETGASVSSLSQDQQRAIRQMEMQAGLPMGFFESLPAIAPQMDVLSTTTRESGGAKYADVVMRDPSTGAITSKSIPLGSTGGPTSLPQFSIADGTPASDQVKQELKAAAVARAQTLPSAGEREGSIEALSTFDTGQDIINALQEITTGPIAGTMRQGFNVFGIPFLHVPGKREFGTTTAEEDRLASLMTVFTARFIKAISGAQVSDKEREFLMGALPVETKQEQANIEGIKAIAEFLSDRYTPTLGIDLSPLVPTSTNNDPLGIGASTPSANNPLGI